MNNKDYQALLEFYQTANRLKNLQRSGWVDFNVNNPESVADHTFGLAMLILYVAQGGDWDLQKCLLMALVHDLAEAEVGDITPRQAIAKEEKLKLEEEALHKILEGQSDKERLLGLWREFANGSTAEGRLVKDLDKLEMAMQAYLYEKDQGVNLEEFFNHCRTKIKGKKILDILEFINQKRGNK